METEQTLVVMFVDISGSTKLFSEHGNERALALTSACIANLKTIINKADGSVVNTLGDGILCTFPSADSAFQAAAEFQEAQRDQQVSIHAGFHYGPVLVKEDSVYGDAVNIASRLADKAKKEEIILSEEVMARLSPQHRESVHPLRNEVFVKGKDEPMRVYKMMFIENEVEMTSLVSRLDVAPLPGLALELIYQGQQIQLSESDEDFVIGRLDECQLAIQNSYVSRRHATIDCTPGKFTLSDHSSNGSYVKDEHGKLTSLNRDSLHLYGSGVISLGIEPDHNPEHVVQFRILDSL